MRAGKVWDLPVRLTHWSFPVLIPAMWLTAENSQWGLHKQLGHVLLFVLTFRIIWGFLGTRTARFASFVRGPMAIISYLRGTSDFNGVGHSPLAALSVIVLLGAMLVQVSLGLFAGDPFDGATGPLNDLVGVMTADRITDIHEIGIYVIGGLVALHLLAIFYYDAIKWSGLVGPMISGRKMNVAPEAEIEPASLLRLITSLAIAAALSLWVWNGAPPL
ncbi:MAG: cytochrome b/b6 domain-containing protein [Pseudomonadota bacterium]